MHIGCFRLRFHNLRIPYSEHIIVGFFHGGLPFAIERIETQWVQQSLNVYLNVQFRFSSTQNREVPNKLISFRDQTRHFTRIHRVTHKAVVEFVYLFVFDMCDKQLSVTRNVVHRAFSIIKSFFTTINLSAWDFFIGQQCTNKPRASCHRPNRWGPPISRR